MGGKHRGPDELRDAPGSEGGRYPACARMAEQPCNAQTLTFPLVSAGKPRWVESTAAPTELRTRPRERDPLARTWKGAETMRNANSVNL